LKKKFYEIGIWSMKDVLKRLYLAHKLKERRLSLTAIIVGTRFDDFVLEMGHSPLIYLLCSYSHYKSTAVNSEIVFWERFETQTFGCRNRPCSTKCVTTSASKWFRQKWPEKWWKSP